MRNRFIRMMRWGVGCAVVAGAAAAMRGDEGGGASPVREGPALIDARESGVGRLVADVEATDVDGKSFRLGDFRGRVVAVCMTDADCPVARKYRPVIEGMKREYEPRGVTLIIVDAKSPRTDRLRRALGARSTTDAFVLDRARTVVYRGAVDDQFGLGFALAKARRTYLRDALDATLSEATPEVRATSAPGCELEGGASAPPVSRTAAPVTYHNRVSRI